MDFLNLICKFILNKYIKFIHFYLFIGEIYNVTYSPTLSSFELKISDYEICNKLIKDIKTNNKDFSQFYTDKNKNLNTKDFLYDIQIPDLNLKLILTNSGICIEFYEFRAPHSRQILIKQIEDIFEKIVSLKDILLKNLNDSWFSILWTPYKSNCSSLLNTSFLSYYELRINGENSLLFDNNYDQLTVFGVLPIKLDSNSNFFLSTINGSVNNDFHSQNEIGLQNNLFLKKSMVN